MRGEEEVSINKVKGRAGLREAVTIAATGKLETEQV